MEQQALICDIYNTMNKFKYMGIDALYALYTPIHKRVIVAQALSNLEKQHYIAIRRGYIVAL